MDLSTPSNLLIAGIYFLSAGLLSLFSVFAVYILIKHGESRTLSLTVSLIYSFFFLTILSQSYQTLQTVLQ